MPPDIIGAEGTWSWIPTPGAPRPDGSKGRDTIRITFTPNAAAGGCKNIRLFQTVKKKAYDAAGDVVGSSNDEIFDPNPFAHQDANHIFVKEDGRWVEVYVDCISCEGDPYYNGGRRWEGQAIEGRQHVGPTDGHDVNRFTGQLFQRECQTWHRQDSDDL